MHPNDVTKNLAFLARRVGALEKKVQSLEEQAQFAAEHAKYVNETLARGREAFHKQHALTQQMIITLGHQFARSTRNEQVSIRPGGEGI